jgi:RNA polymerase sigma-70 factor, ECF subfamily
LTDLSSGVKIAPTDEVLMVAPDVTALLHAWNEGDLDARAQVMALVYEELRRRALAHMRRERQGHLLQPTALVHEAYLRLVDQRHTAWRSRAQFLAVAAEIMRRILVDWARAHRTSKRSGQWSRVSLDPAAATGRPSDVDLLDLDTALTRLATLDPRKSRIAELRFFAGLSLEEAGHVLQVSPRTVERDWEAARAWLFKALTGGRRAAGDSTRHDS